MSNPYYTPLDLLRTTVAASAAFQTWVGATGEDAAALVASALERIYLIAIGSADWARPYAIVGVGSWAAELAFGGSRHFFSHPSDLELCFEADLAGVDDETAWETFLDTVGDILLDIEELAGTPGYLAITAIRQEEPPQRCRDDAREGADAAAVFAQVKFKVAWND
jgi:hypothetical protein